MGDGGPNLIWIEAERFDDLGGWTRDTQFIDQMGSPYVLAVGLGRPVADAVTTQTVARPGRYRLWARTRDWVPEHHPGRFEVLVDGAVARTCGASGVADWAWEDCGAHDLGATVRLALHDLTGYYGRCDALVLAADLSWRPPADPAALAPLRERWGGVSQAVVDAGEWDVVVAGGGLAGCVAAVAAARLGCRVALLQNRAVLGGNASTEILVPPVGVWPHSGLDPWDPRETGLVEEFRTLGNQRTEEALLYSGRLARWVAAEPTLDLFLETHVSGVELSDEAARVITAALTVDARTGERRRFGGRVFCDCTGDGGLGVAAGAEFRQGREARAAYGESMAPEVADATTMGNSLKYVSVPTGAPVAFETPPWALHFPTCESFPPRRHPRRLGADIEWQWILELGGLGDTFRDKEATRDELLRLIYGIWGHLKNDCPELGEQAADHALAWVGHVVGVRETRRLLGDYVLTEQDIAEQTRFDDRVAYGAWGLDDHYSAGFFYDGPPSVHPCQGVVYSVPYRSLYSRNVANLLLAGRNLSASHVALGDTRVMLTCAVIGQAAGTAAALCVAHQTTPRGVLARHLAALQQQLLKDGAWLVDLPNTDARDLARAATVTASSETVDAAGERLAAANVIDGSARAVPGRRGAWLAAAGPAWLELAWPAAQTFNLVHVIWPTTALAAAAFRLEAWVGEAWQTLVTVAANQRRRCLVAVPRTSSPRLRLVLEEPAPVCEVRVYDEPAEALAAAARAGLDPTVADAAARYPWA